MKTKECPECGDELPPHSNAKRVFCCDTCKNKFNLKKRQRENMHLFSLYLEKNFKVLKIWEKHKLLHVTKKQLIDNGFSFDFLPMLKKNRFGFYYEFGKFHLYLNDDSREYYIFKNFTFIIKSIPFISINENLPKFEIPVEIPD